MAMVEMRFIWNVVRSRLDWGRAYVNASCVTNGNPRHLRSGGIAMLKRVTAFALFAALFATPPAAVTAMDGVMMKNGQMMMMKDGKATAPMPSDMTMDDGTKVTTSGVVRMKGGEVKPLDNGDIILMDGHVMKGGKATPMRPQ